MQNAPAHIDESRKINFSKHVNCQSCILNKTNRNTSKKSIANFTNVIVKIPKMVRHTISQIKIYIHKIIVPQKKKHK